LTDDGAVYFLANSESTDFDVTENFGGEDIWLVKLTEEGSMRVEDDLHDLSLSVFPNPCTDHVNISSDDQLLVSVYDMVGNEVLRQQVNPSGQIEVKMLPAGTYVLRGMNDAHQKFVARLVKL